MLAKRLIATLLILALIVMGVMRPTPARADLGTDLALAAGAAGFWVLVVVVGTSLAYGPPWSTSAFTEEPGLDRKDPPPPSTIHFGPRCPSFDGSPPGLVCW